MGKLSAKVTIITGGGSGIGRATAILFAREGARVIVADCLAEGAQETVKAITTSGGEATSVEVDVCRPADVERMIDTAMTDYGQLDVLFNNAGIEQLDASIDETSEATWDKLISINLKGVFLGIKYAVPAMLDKGGVIINTASTAGLVGFPQAAAYGASKAGVISLTKTAALEYARRNIRVNCICPGGIRTPLFARVTNNPQRKTAAPLRSPRIIDRPGTPEEVARAALFLASDDSSFVTGTVLAVDGGYTAL